jgi:hypothetical protein
MRETSRTAPKSLFVALFLLVFALLTAAFSAVPEPALAVTASISITSPYDNQPVSAPFAFKAYTTASVSAVTIGVYLTASPLTGLLDSCSAAMENDNPQMWRCDTINFSKITGNGDNKYYAIAHFNDGQSSIYSNSVPFYKSGGIALTGVYLDSPKSTDNPAPGAPLPLVAKTIPTGAAAASVEFQVTAGGVPVAGSPFVGYPDSGYQIWNYGSWYPTVGSYTITPKATSAAGGSFIGYPVNVTVGQGQYPTSIVIEAPTAGSSSTISPNGIELKARVEPTTLSDAAVTFTLTSAGGTPPSCTGTVYQQGSQRYVCQWYPTASGSYTLTATAYKNGQSATTQTPVTFSVTDAVVYASGVFLDSPKGTDNPAPNTLVMLKAGITPSGSIASKVDFSVHDNGKKTTELFTVNYADADSYWYWKNWVPAAGTYTVTPIAYGQQAVYGAPVTFTVGAAPSASLALDSPDAGQQFSSLPIPLSATASGSFPSTGKVKFTVTPTAGGSPVVLDAALSGAVASYSWSGASSGSYTVQAELYNPLNPTVTLATAGPVSFSYQPTAPPTIGLAMTYPAPNATISGSSATFKADVTGSGYSKIKFFVYYAGTSGKSEPQQLGEALAAVSSGIASATWAIPTTFADGNYETVATALDSLGNKMAQSLPVVWIYAKPVAAPTVSVSTPTAGGKVYAPQGNFTAYASGDGIASLKFLIYAEGATTHKYLFDGKPSTVTAGGYTGTWAVPAEVPSGYYEVTAAVYDSKQVKLVESKRVKFLLVQVTTVTHSVGVTSPSAGAVLSGIALNFYASSTGTGIDEVVFSVFAKGGAAANATALGSIAVKPSSTSSSSWSATWPVPTTMADGDYEVQAKALDTMDKVLVKSSAVVFAYKRTAAQQTALSITYPYGSPVLPGPNIGFTVAASGTAPSGVVLFVYDKGQSSVAGASAVTTVVAKPAAIGWAATWTVADTQSDGEFEAVAVAYDSSGKEAARSKAVSFSYVKPEQATLQAVMTMPKTGVVLSKAASLSATVSRKADEVYFIVSGGDTASTQPFALKASSDQDGLIWSYDWDTTAVANGKYAAMAKATSGGETVTSDAVSFSVLNEGTEAVPTVSVSVVAPTSGETISGSYEIHATTSAKVDSLIFVISRKDGTVSPVTLRVPYADSTGLVWKLSWDTTRSANSSYYLKAKAFSSEKLVGESAAVGVSIENQEVTTTAPLPTVEPVSETEPAETVASVEETAETAVPLAARIVKAPSEAKGIVLFSAAAYGQPDTLKFVVKPMRGTGAHEVSAALDSTTGWWTAMWNSKNAADGLYAVVAVAKRSDGQQATTTASYMTVKNAVLAATGTAVSTAAAVAEVTVLPAAVVKEAVTAIPADTKLIAVGTVAPSVVETTSKLDEKCVAARIPAERCGAWLAWQNRDTECVRANILTKEECVSYLQEKLGQVSDEEAARNTVGLVSVSDIDRLNRAVTGLIGSNVRFKRAVAEATPTKAAAPAAESTPVPSLPDDVAAYVPLKGDKDMGLAVQASPAFVKADDGTGRKSVSAVIFIDTDGDGLPDDVEKRWGTDPKKADTDGDGFGDGTEVKNGYNPLGAGKLADSSVQAAAVDAAIISGAPIEQPKAAGKLTSDLSVDRAEVKVEGGGVTRIAGRAKPGETVTIFVYSYLPVVVTATADENGNWQYDIESSLVDGQHTAYVALADETGKITEKGSPLAFFVSGAQAATEEEFFKTSTMLAEEPMTNMFRWYAIGAGILIVSALVIGLAIVFRKPKSSGDLGAGF